MKLVTLKRITLLSMLALTIALCGATTYVKVTGNTLGNPDIFAIVPIADLPKYQ